MKFSSNISAAGLKETWASKAIFALIIAAFILSVVLYGAVHESILALFYASAFVLAVFWTIDAFANKALRFGRSRTQIPLLLALVLAAAQIIPFGSETLGGVENIARTISIAPAETMLFIIHVAALFIYFAAAHAFINSPKRLRKTAFIIAGFGFAYAFYAILQSFLSPKKIYGIYEITYAEPFGSFVNKHNFASLMEMCIALPLGVLFGGAIEQGKKLLFGTAIGVMGIALILSGSRGGLVSLVAAVIFLVIVSGIGRKTKGLLASNAFKILLAFVLLATIIGGSMIVGGDKDSSLTRIAESVGSKDPTSSRTHIWKVTLEMIKDKPIFGTGFGGYPSAYPKFDQLSGAERVEQAHNDYLQLMSDAGIFGLLIGAFFIFALVREGFGALYSADKMRRGIALGALAGCFAIGVHSIFDFVLHVTAITLTFLVLAVLAVAGREVEDAKEIEMHDRLRRSSKSKPATITPISRRRDEAKNANENQPKKEIQPPNANQPKSETEGRVRIKRRQKDN